MGTKSSVKKTAGQSARKPPAAAKPAAPKKKAVKQTVKQSAGSKKRVTAKKASVKKAARKQAAKKPARKAAPRKKTVKKAVKKAVEKPTKKATAKATKSAEKPAAEKAVTRKAAATKATKKAATKPAAREKISTSNKRDSRSRAVRQPPRLLIRRPAVMLPEDGTKRPVRRKKLSAKEKEVLREMLLERRRHFSEQVNVLRNESLQRFDSVNSVEDGTDAFDRQFALSIAGTEQESLAAIDDALHRLDEGTYGLCESCGCTIQLTRLKALPFVSNCIECQAATERNRPRRRIY